MGTAGSFEDSVVQCVATAKEVGTKGVADGAGTSPGARLPRAFNEKLRILVFPPGTKGGFGVGDLSGQTYGVHSDHSSRGGHSRRDSRRPVRTRRVENQVAMSR